MYKLAVWLQLTTKTKTNCKPNCKPNCKKTLLVDPMSQAKVNRNEISHRLRLPAGYSYTRTVYTVLHGATSLRGIFIEPITTLLHTPDSANIKRECHMSMLDSCGQTITHLVLSITITLHRYCAFKSTNPDTDANADPNGLQSFLLGNGVL
jgi:hypothetical protein